MTTSAPIYLPAPEFYWSRGRESDGEWVLKTGPGGVLVFGLI